MSEKREMWHLEAFAMLGALAWQATTIIKMFLVSRGEIARGLFYSSPGFSPHRVLLCSLSAAPRPIRLAGTTFYVANRSWSYRPKDKGTTDNLQLKYTWTYTKVALFIDLQMRNYIVYTEEFVITNHLSGSLLPPPSHHNTNLHFNYHKRYKHNK